MSIFEISPCYTTSMDGECRSTGIHKLITALIAVIAVAFSVKMFLKGNLLFGFLILWAAFIGVDALWVQVSRDLKKQQEESVKEYGNSSVGTVKPESRIFTSVFLMKFRAAFIILAFALIILSLKYTFIDDDVLGGISAFVFSLSILFFLWEAHRRSKE